MSEALQYFYDAEADVLYVSKGEPRADADSDEVGEGVVARFDPITREVVGFTVLNFLKRAEKSLPACILPFTAELRLVT
ncbi:MAG TPA: DUF2283 domain-containing protein [Candidatus Binatia bacterium]|nr:DUF2283 domain-containing protein [Candidatus Binatia bacterium]